MLRSASTAAWGRSGGKPAISVLRPAWSVSPRNAIEQACFGEEAFPKEELLTCLEGCSAPFGLYVDERLVGYALVRQAFGMGYLYSNAILPEFQGKGFGQQLMAKRLRSLAHCSNVQAHTRLDNKTSAHILV